MVLFPIAVLWLAAVLIWVIRNGRNEDPQQERTWRRWSPRPRRPRDGETPGARSRGKRAGATRR